MTQAQLERELSSATGESMGEIRRRGFQFQAVPDLKPLLIDWDAIDQQRTSYLPQRSRVRRTA